MRYTGLSGSVSPLSNRDIDSNFDKIELVANSISDINAVADELPIIQVVSDNIADIVSVVEAATKIENLEVDVQLIGVSEEASATLVDSQLTLNIPRGMSGIDGEDGDIGLSAYQVWLGTGKTGSEESFLLDIKGPNGRNGLGINNVRHVSSIDRLTQAAYPGLPAGTIGYIDIYKIYADDNSTIELGEFRVSNASLEYDPSGPVIKSVYESNDDTNAFTDDDKSKLEDSLSVEQLAELTADNRNRDNHTGTQSIETITETDDLKIMTTAERALVGLVSGKQDQLVSQVNIKSINGDSIIGNGNLVVAAGSGGYAANVFFGSTPSVTVPAYDTLSYSPEETETILTATVNNNEVLMKKFLFDGDVLAEDIPAGEWGFHTYRSVSDSAGDTSIRFEVFSRQADGTENILFTRSSRSIEDTDVERGSVLTTQRTFDISPTDRIGISLYAATTNTEDTVVSISLGDGEASYIVSPLQLRHNQLRNRDAENSHPIEAIDGLRAELTGITSSVTQLGTSTAQNLAEADGRLTQGIADGDAALSSTISTLETTINGNITDLDDRLSTSISTLDSSTTTALGLKADETDLEAHTSNVSNPHSVTKADVSLGNADNTSDIDKPISTLALTAIGLKADGSALTTHTDSTSNPHSVTKSQVGLANADNTSDASKPISDLTLTALGLKADSSVVDSHIASTSNPHSVSAAQIGLGSVDNTSDADKPISSAQQVAIDLKATATTVYTRTEADVLLDDKANASEVYTSVATDLLLDDKADTTSTYTRDQIDSLVATESINFSAGTVQSSGSTTIAGTTITNGFSTDLYTGNGSAQTIVNDVDFISSADYSGISEWNTNQELVTNGTFDTDASGWAGTGGTSVSTSVSGNLKVSRSGSVLGVNQVIAVVPNEEHIFTMDVIVGPQAQNISLTIDGVLVSLVANGSGSKSLTHIFTPTTNSMIITLGVYGSDGFWYADNVSVKKVQVYNTGDEVTITREGRTVRVVCLRDNVTSTPINLYKFVDEAFNDWQIDSQTNGGLAWIKARNGAGNHNMFDTVRGKDGILYPNGSNAELNSGVVDIMTFNGNGISLNGNYDVNLNGTTYVSWSYQTTHIKSRLTSHGKPQIEEYNPITGFTIIKYKGDLTADNRVYNSVGKLDLLHIKSLETVSGWLTQHREKSLLSLNTTGASTPSALGVNAITDEYVSLGSGTSLNDSSLFILYGWTSSTETDGKIKGNFDIGTYTGTGSASGNKIYTKRKPLYVLIKKISGVENWYIVDSVRGQNRYVTVTSSGESGAFGSINIEPDGFSLITTNTDFNGGGDRYLYMVVYDDGSGKSKYDAPSATSNLNIANGGFGYTEGKDQRGYKTEANSFSGTVPTIGQDGLKWIAKDKDADTFKFFDNKPSNGLYEKTSAGDNRIVLLDGKQYLPTDVELQSNNFSQDTSGWNNYTTEILAVDSGRLKVDRNGASYGATYTIPTVTGETYRVIVEASNVEGAGTISQVRIGTTSTDGRYFDSSGESTYDITFTALTTTTSLNLWVAGNVNGVVYYNSVSAFKQEPTLGTAISPLSFIKNPVMFINGVPQFIDYTDYLADSYTDVVEFEKVIAKEFTGKNACTAWVNYDDVAIPASIKDSFNVSDVVYTSLGFDTIYFEEDMDNTNYTVVFGNKRNRIASVAAKYVDRLDVRISNFADANDNSNDINIVIFGGKR